MFKIMKVHLRLLRFNIIFRPFICIIGTLSHFYFLMSLKHKRLVKEQITWATIFERFMRFIEWRFYLIWMILLIFF